MSDTTATPTTDAPKPSPPAQAPEADAKVETDWKAEARKWEDLAKKNKSAAEQLAAIEEANKTEAQKAAEREAAALKRATEAEAKVTRRELALEHKLSKEDAALLDGITDEAAMKALAARLAGAESDRKKQGNVAPREGSNPNPVKSDDMRSFANELFGRAAQE